MQEVITAAALPVDEVYANEHLSVGGGTLYEARHMNSKKRLAF